MKPPPFVRARLPGLPSIVWLHTAWLLQAMDALSILINILAHQCCLNSKFNALSRIPWRRTKFCTMCSISMCTPASGEIQAHQDERHELLSEQPLIYMQSVGHARDACTLQSQRSAFSVPYRRGSSWLISNRTSEQLYACMILPSSTA